MDDRELVKRIAGGDRQAMKSLYERHSGPLFHFIRSRMRDPFEAADVMQETFLEIWRSAARYQGRSSARTWFFSIARNKAVDRLRRLGRMEVREPDDTLPDDAPNPEHVAAAASDAERLRHCIEGLSGAQQSAIRLAFYEDLAYPEVAEAEGVPLGTIKTRIHHAKRLLMACLGGRTAMPA